MKLGSLKGHAKLCARDENRRVGGPLGMCRGMQHVAIERNGQVWGGALGEGSEERVPHECRGIGSVREEEESVVEVAGGGGCAEVEEPANGDAVLG